MDCSGEQDEKEDLPEVGKEISSFAIAKDVFNLDSRIEPTDALHYAISIKDNANTFVSFDRKMERNKILENAFGVKIIHPENL